MGNKARNLQRKWEDDEYKKICFSEKNIEEIKVVEIEIMVSELILGTRLWIVLISFKPVVYVGKRREERTKK